VKLKIFLENYRREIEKSLEEIVLEEGNIPPLLKEGLKYSLMNGGKRIRPLLSLLTCYVLGGKVSKAVKLSLSIELVHTSSIILDDLPSMDNSFIRRGKPSLWKKFGEDLAVLIAFSLLNSAYFLLLKEALKFPQEKYPVERYLEAFFKAIGFEGLISGQFFDLHPEKEKTFETLEKIHSLKTGALFILSVKLGAMAAQGKPKELEALEIYAKNLGLAFQIQDDLLDLLGDEKEMGKPKGKDTRKITFTNILGVEDSKKAVDALINTSIDALKPLKEKGGLLKEFAQYVRERKN
jgi:geranylgeranyl diphosphate synthase type II